jgi:hypothetical protein
MTQQLPWEQADPNLVSAAQHRRSVKAKMYIDGSALVRLPNIEVSATASAEPIESIPEDIRHVSAEVGVADRAQKVGPPRICEVFMCLAVEPEFQEDRLADYQERFNNLWVPKFGWRGAVVVYVWHVLRQSRLIDWLIRMFGWGTPP